MSAPATRSLAKSTAAASPSPPNVRPSALGSVIKHGTTDVVKAVHEARNGEGKSDVQRVVADANVFLSTLVHRNDQQRAAAKGERLWPHVKGSATSGIHTSVAIPHVREFRHGTRSNAESAK
jgi:hypothetical protein